MPNMIDGLAISGYRSFGSIQRIGSFEKVNLFIGPNNSGKSNILRFIHEHLGTVLSTRAQPKLNPNLDFYEPMKERVIEIAIGESHASDWYEKVRKELEDRSRVEFDKALSSPGLSFGTDCVWSPLLLRLNENPKSVDSPKGIEADLLNDQNLTANFWHILYTRLPGNAGRHAARQIERIRAFIDYATRVDRQFPTVSLIPPIRQIVDEDASEILFDGKGLIRRLAELERPHHHQQHKKEQFQKVIRFLRTVIGDDSARLEITHDSQQINVDFGGKVLPLKSLGTGVHQVVILAAAATIFSDQIVCIEEPEIHLHPILQRKLVNYLLTETSNQYFIATHSAHLLDINDNTAIFRVSQKSNNGQNETEVSKVQTSHDRWSVCRDLGYRSSDILQANCIIWVEGPSDRIYVNYWIQATDSELIEGVHYSIMFYGGRLLSHLSADDPEITDFISLVGLNRNVGMMIDSDKTSARNRLNKTKSRVRDSIDNAGGYVWITEGREIENYLPSDALRECAEKVSSGTGNKIKLGKYENQLQLPAKGKSRKKRTIDKVKVAHAMTDYDPDFSIFDLSKRIHELVQFVRQCN